MSDVLAITDLHVAVAGKPILKGVNLVNSPRRSPRPDGPQRLGQEHAGLCHHGPSRLRSHQRPHRAQRRGRAGDGAERAGPGRHFLAFQRPMAIPGVKMADFLRHAATNVRRPDRKEGEELIPMREFRKELNAKMEQLRMDKEFARRYVNDGFSGGEMKRAEILQLAMLRPKFAILDETDSGLDVDAVRLASQSIAEIGGAGHGHSDHHAPRAIARTQPARTSRT